MKTALRVDSNTSLSEGLCYYIHMLAKEDALDFDFYGTGQVKSRRHIFKCRECAEFIKVRTCKLSKHSGLCFTCALSGRTLRPFEAKYKRLLDSHFKKQDPGIPVSYEDFLEFTKTKTCHYCLGEIIWFSTKKTGLETSGGLNLDRLDCSIGYCPGNLVVCCWSCNFTKQDHITHDAMLEIGPILLKHGIQGRKQGRIGVPHKKLTPEQRAASTSKRVKFINKTGLKGVHWRKSNQKWCAQIRILGKNHSLGCYDTAEDAGRAFDKKAYELYGPAAGLNFPQEYSVTIQ